MTDDPKSDELDQVLDVSIRRRWPRPVALAWGRVGVAREPHARLEALLRFSEVLFRTLAVVGIADYLSGEPAPGSRSDRNHPESLLRKLSRPADGDWHKLACVLPLACAQRAEGAFMPELAAWLTAPHSVHHDNQRALGWLVKLRNDARHGSGGESSSAVAQRAADYEQLLRQLLSQLLFLGDYRFVRVVSTTAMSVEGSFRGAVDVWAGTDEFVERIDTIWRGWLPAGSIYVITPNAERALLVSPLVQVRDSEANRIQRFFLLKQLTRKGQLVLADDRHGELAEPEREARRPSGEGIRAWFDADARRKTPISDIEGKLHARAELRQFENQRVAEKYTMHEVLGCGGMGTVFRATHELLHREVALKVLNPELSSDPTVQERFLREARLMHELQSPNVLRALDTGQLPDGRLYIASELADGGSLADVAGSGPAEPEQVTEWLVDAASGLAAIHAIGVVHRDVKPANLLLRGGHVLVSDLGIARVGTDSSLTRTHEQLGTGPYMSPEQHRGMPLTPATDIYSLGIVAHELLTGSRADWSYGRAIPGKLGAIIRRMCDTDPAERPTALEVARVLSDAAAERQLEAGAASGQPRSALPPGPPPGPAPTPGPQEGRAPSVGTQSSTEQRVSAPADRSNAFERIGPPTHGGGAPPAPDPEVDDSRTWSWLGTAGLVVAFVLFRACFGG